MDPRRWWGARSCRRLVVATSLGIAATTGPASGQRVQYTGSLQAATGEYIFTERTTSLALFNGLALDLGRMHVIATLPIVYQNSAAVTYIGGTPVPTGGPGSEAVRRRQDGTRVPMGLGGKGRGGTQSLTRAAALDTDAASDIIEEPGEFQVNVGDPLLQLDVDVYRGVGLVTGFILTAVAKVPLADVESGIGTGVWDYGAGALVSFGAGRTFVFANATYWVVGDMPDLPLDNTLSYGASVGRWFGGGRWSMSGSVIGSTSAVETSAAPLAAGVGVSYLAEGGNGINAGVTFGLSESSPELATYVGWRLPIGKRTSKR